MVEHRIIDKENRKEIELFTDDTELARAILDSLSCYEYGYKNNPAYQRGNYDGKLKFYQAATIKGEGHFISFSLGFVKRVNRLLKKRNLPLIETPKPSIDPVEVLKKYMPELPFRPYPHQLKATVGLITNFNHLAVSSTGSGKSLVIYLSTRHFYDIDKKILILVPSIDLTSQLYGDFKDYNAPENFMKDIQLMGGEFKSKEITKRIVISTWQSAHKADLSNFDVVINDEVHTAKADVLRDILLSNPFEYRLGLTGTFPIIKEDAYKLEENFGKPVRYISAKEMIELGLSTDVTVYSVFLKHEHVRLMKYNEERDYIIDSLPRRKFVTRFLKKISSTGQTKGLTIALYANTRHGIQTWEDLTGLTFNGKVQNNFLLMKELGVFYISGSTRSSVRTKIRQYLKEIDGTENVILIGQIGILSTGINIPSLKNLVFLSSSKSFIKIIQSIGRVLRLHQSKQKAFVFDLVDDLSGDSERETENYSLKHFWYRLAYYESEGFEIKELEYDLRKI